MVPLAPEIGDLGVIPVAASAAGLLGSPLVSGTLIFGLIDPSAIKELAIDDLTADMESLRKLRGRVFRMVPVCHGGAKCGLRHQKIPPQTDYKEFRCGAAARAVGGYSDPQVSMPLV